MSSFAKDLKTLMAAFQKGQTTNITADHRRELVTRANNGCVVAKAILAGEQSRNG